MTRLRGILALAVLLSGTFATLAHDYEAGSIAIRHPWSRPTPPSAPVASGYLTLTNTGTEEDRLLAVTSPIAKRTEIHRSTVENGVASMRPMEDGVALEPGQTVDFQAERLHLMFIGPIAPLEDGSRFPATLVFAKAGRVEVEFAVQRKPPETAPDDHSAHGARQ